MKWVIPIQQVRPITDIWCARLLTTLCTCTCTIALLPLILQVFAIPLENSLEPRQQATTYIRDCGGPITVLAKNPHPTQWYLHMQVTDPVSCGNGGCSAGKIDTHTITYTVSGGGGINFFSFFSATSSLTVGKGTTKGETITCDGDDGEQVCIWASIAHTEYTVYERNKYSKIKPKECGKWSTPERRMNAPNGNFVGSHYYCVRNNCRNNGDRYWGSAVYEGKPGPRDSDIGNKIIF